MMIRAAALSTVLALTGTALLAQQSQPGVGDLRALRYYIAQGETEAVAAEVRRLQIDFPGWVPPADLNTLLVTGPTTQIDEIYAAIARGDTDTARNLVTQTQTAFPDWTPPAEMIELLGRTAAQTDFDRALDAGQLDRAATIASANPQLLRCNTINNTWRLAELQAAGGHTSAAMAAYRQIVQTCSAIPDIISTIEKANEVATIVELAGLIQTAKSRLPAASAELTRLEEQLLAGRGVAPAPLTTTEAPAETPTPESTPAPAPNTAPPVAVTPPAPRVTPPTPTVAATTAAPQTGAVAVAPTGTTGYANLPRTGDSRLSQTRSAAAAEDFRACTAASQNPRSIDIAYERAWCVYNLDRPLEALALFSAAAQASLGGNVPRDSRYGMALSMLQLDMTDAASQIAATTDLARDQRVTVETIILDQRGVRSYEQGDFRRAIDYFNALEAMEGSLRRDLALLRGYAYLNSGDRAQALREFQRLNTELSTPGTRDAIQTALRSNQ